VVTLEGEADDMSAKTRAMEEFGKLVETENTVNRIRVKATAPVPVAEPTPAAAAILPDFTSGAPTAAAERRHEVVAGETLGKIAQHYYGKASLYTKLFEAK